MRPRFELAKIEGRKFANKHTNTYYTDIVGLIHKMGWKLVIFRLNGEEGYTFYNPESGLYQINIDNNGSPIRNRFTLAHEIGHIVMAHHTQFNCSELSDEMEKALDLEASVVAGEILMPYKYIKLWNTDFETMKLRFDVSRSALETRLKFLGYELAV